MVVFCLWMVFCYDNKVEYHKRAWLKESQRMVGGPARGISLRRIWDEIFPRLRQRIDPGQEMRRHEDELKHLGYLTTRSFLLTNQMTTPEFRSNFFNTVWQRFGTNGECVWTCQTLTNQTGYIVTLPAQDVAAWEHIFRDCAARYASNLPPLLSTNTPPQ